MRAPTRREKKIAGASTPEAGEFPRPRRGGRGTMKQRSYVEGPPGGGQEEKKAEK